MTDQETTEKKVELPSKYRRAWDESMGKHLRIKGLLAELRDFGNQTARIKVKWAFAGMMVFLISVILTQVQFNSLNSRERDKIVANQEAADYVGTLGAYNQSMIVYKSCIEAVGRSDGNRRWKSWLLDELEVLFPNSDNANIIVTDGREKLDEYLPARSLDECVDPGPPPTPKS